MSDIEDIHHLVFEMDGELTELDTTITALFRAMQPFAEGADDGCGDLDYHVADAIASKLALDYKALRERYGRLFDLTRVRGNGDAGRNLGAPTRLEPPFDLSVPAPTPGTDDALLEASRRVRALEDFWNDQREPPEDAYADELSAFQHFIAKTPAIGAAGVRAKFEEGLGLDSLGGAAIGSDLVETINEALDRLAKGGAP